MAHVLNRRQTRTANDVDEVEVIDIDTPPPSPTTSSKWSTQLTNVHADPHTVAVEKKKDAEIITIDEDDETSLNWNYLRRVSPVSGRKASTAEERLSTKAAGRISDEATFSTNTKAHTRDLPKPPCKELNEDALWKMISAKAWELREAGTNEGRTSYEALILFRQMTAEVLAEKISNTDEPDDDILGRHADACNAGSLRLGQLLRISEHLKSLTENCLKIKHAAQADHANECVDTDDDIMVIEEKQSNVSLRKRPPVRSSSGEPCLRIIGSPASDRFTIGKSRSAAGRSMSLSRETRATTRTDLNSGNSRLIIGTQSGPSLIARPYRTALKKVSTRAELGGTQKASPAGAVAKESRTPSPDKGCSRRDSSQQHEDSVQSATEDTMLTDGVESQAQLLGRDGGTVVADRSDRFDSGVETSYAEDRMDTSEPNSFEDSAIYAPGEDYQCEEMVDADSVRVKDDVCTDVCGKVAVRSTTDQAPLQVPPVCKPSATTYMDDPTKVDTASTRGREGRSPMRKKAVVSPGRSRMPFTGTVRTKSSPPRRHSFFTDPDQPSSSAHAYRESSSPIKKPRWSSADTTIVDNSRAKGSPTPRDKRALSSDSHVSGPSTSSTVTTKALHLRNRQQPAKAKRDTDALENDESTRGSSECTAQAAPSTLRGLLKRGGCDGTIALNGAGSLDQGTEKRRVSWPIDEEQPTRYGSPWAKVTTYRKTFYHPDGPDPRTLDLLPPRRVFTAPFELPAASSDTLQISVPNADEKFAWDPYARMDPLQYPKEAQRSKQISQELLNEAADAFRAVTHAREIRHWIITDSMLKGLRDDVLHQEKMLLTRFEWPALPSLLCDSLECADVNGGVETGRTRVVLSRVFIVLGFDVALFHSSEEDDFGADMVTDEVQKLIKWFFANVHEKEVCRVKDFPESTDTYGNDIWGELDITYHTSAPPIVLVTIPEVPDDEVLAKWEAHNAHFRWFVKEFTEKNQPVDGCRLVELLDWAELCQNNPEVARTNEGRVQLLFEEMNLRYGVLLQSNVVDNVPVNGDDDDDGDEA